MRFVTFRLLLTGLLLIGSGFIVSITTNLLNGSTEDFLLGLVFSLVNVIVTLNALSTIWSFK